LARRKKKTDTRQRKISMQTENQETRSIRIPMIAAKYIAGTLCLLTVLLMGVFCYYRQASHMAIADQAELETLRKSNDVQVNEIAQLSRVTIGLQADMERLNSLDAEIRHILNNEDLKNTSRAGLIRPSVTGTSQYKPQEQLNLDELNHVVDDLQVAVKVREQSLEELKQQLLDKQRKIAAKPSIWPARGEVTSRFGWRSLGGGEYHPGIDIANNIGTPIVATGDGQVVYSDWDSGGYGKLVKIDHNNGIVTLYGHTSQIVVHNGENVKKGQVIAYVGNTGYSTGPHVHYEVRVNGTAVNPASFLN